MAESTTRFGAVDENFSKTIQQMEGRLEGFTGSVQSVNQSTSALPAVFKTAAVAVAAFVASVAGAALGLKTFQTALDFVGRLDDLSKQTGAAKDSLVLLQTAFDNTGSSASKVGPALTRVQDIIAKAGDQSPKAVAALQNLGLTFSNLKNLTPEQQFEAVMTALGNIPSRSEQAQAAVALFGQTLGREMIPLAREFQQEMKKAGEELGSLPEVLDQFGPSLTRFEENIDALKKKPEQFAVGFVAPMSAILGNLAGLFRNFDAAGLGVAIGTALNNTLTEMLYWAENVSLLLGSIWDGLVSPVLSPILGWVYSQFEAFIKPTRELVGTVYNNLRDADYQGIGEKISNAINYGLEPLKDFNRDPDAALNNFYARLEEMNNGFAQHLRDAVIRGLEEGVKLSRAFEMALDSKVVNDFGERVGNGVVFGLMHVAKRMWQAPLEMWKLEFAVASDKNVTFFNNALSKMFRLVMNDFVTAFTNPSRLMAEQFGKFIIGAFLDGLKVFVDKWNATSGGMITKFGAAYNAIMSDSGKIMVGAAEETEGKTRQAAANLSQGGKELVESSAQAKQNIADAKMDVTAPGGISPALDANANALSQTADKTKSASGTIVSAYEGVAKSGQSFTSTTDKAGQSFNSQVAAAGKSFAADVKAAMGGLTDAVRGFATESTLRIVVEELRAIKDKVGNPVLVN